MTRKKQLWWKK